MSNKENNTTQNTFNFSGNSITNFTASGDINYSEAIETKNALTPKKESYTYDMSSDKFTILFLGANPLDTSRLRLGEEVRKIADGLKRSKHRDKILLEQRWATRPRDLSRALLELKPRIVHFSGHGTDDEGLAFEDDSGMAELIKSNKLSALFDLFSDCVECVILNACYSESQAEAIFQHIPYVIGMTGAIDDKAAIDFSVGFYDALGNGESIDFSYQFSKSILPSNIFLSNRLYRK